MRNTIPSIPIPDFEKRLVDDDEVKELQNRTIQADPLTGKSTSDIKYTYADIARRFHIKEPSEYYCPSAEDMANFHRANPHVTIVHENEAICFSEQNPDEQEFSEMPPVESLFHNLNQSVVYDQ
jgi:hypothetical protein